MVKSSLRRMGRGHLFFFFQFSGALFLIVCLSLEVILTHCFLLKSFLRGVKVLVPGCAL